jgi:hypothetical protein
MLPRCPRPRPPRGLGFWPPLVRGGMECGWRCGASGVRIGGGCGSGGIGTGTGWKGEGRIRLESGRGGDGRPNGKGNQLGTGSLGLAGSCFRRRRGGGGGPAVV